MAPTDRVLAEKWMRAAERDLAAVEYLRGADPPFIEQALFLCQQAAEKSLKAVLIAKGISPPRTHDLLTIWLLASKVVSEWTEPMTDLTKLASYAVTPRYPVPESRYTAEDINTAVDSAGAVLRSAKEAL